MDKSKKTFTECKESGDQDDRVEERLDLACAWIVSEVTEAVIPEIRDAVQKEVESSTSGPDEGRSLLDVEEVAEYLGVSVRTVEKIIADERLRPLWVRGQRRFTRKAVNSYVESCASREGRTGQ